LWEAIILSKTGHLTGRPALVVLGCLFGLALLLFAIGAMRGVLLPSLSYLAAPLVFILIGLIRAGWPKFREQLRQRSTIARLRKIGEHKPYGAPPDEYGFVNRVTGQAAQLPLMDAAFHLWTHKHHLDRFEGFYPPPNQPLGDLTDHEVFGKAVREAIRNVHADRENAQFGTTFLRLEKLYPGARKKDLQQAIKAAVKLDVDCTQNFSYKSQNYLDDVTRAVEIAKAANPGFQDTTYQAAWNSLATAMR
jgi:hypothetical protein